jgi:hypothetical protein
MGSGFAATFFVLIECWPILALNTRALKVTIRNDTVEAVKKHILASY